MSPRHDLDKGFAIVFGQMETRPNTSICSTSRTPTSSASFALFCHRAADLGRVMHPHLKPVFVIGNRTPPFHQIARRSPPIEGDLPLFRLCQDPLDASPAKLRFVYTPGTAPTASDFDDLGGWRPAYSRREGSIVLAQESLTHYTMD